jgi:phosphate transport system substrate-binding protein
LLARRSGIGPLPAGPFAVGREHVLGSLYQQWIKVYRDQRPALSINYDAVGRDEGINRFVAGSVDFGASDVVLSGREIARIPKGIVTVPAIAGMVVLAYNVPKMQAELRLPRDLYSGTPASSREQFGAGTTRGSNRRIRR